MSKQGGAESAKSDLKIRDEGLRFPSNKSEVADVFELKAETLTSSTRARSLSLLNKKRQPFGKGFMNGAEHSAAASPINRAGTHMHNIMYLIQEQTIKGVNGKMKESGDTANSLL